jgi:hypothetical protein
MPFDHLQAPKCKFCAGRLRFDFERKDKARGFSYYRCEECDLPNIFSAQSAQPAFPYQ